MAREIIYHPLFRGDVVEAANWYDARSTGLGDAFVEKVKSTITTIILAPNRYASVTLGMRYLRVKRFPYMVLFLVTDEQIYFLGVLHTARSIEKWRKKRG